MQVAKIFLFSKNDEKLKISYDFAIIDSWYEILGNLQLIRSSYLKYILTILNS